MRKIDWFKAEVHRPLVAALNRKRTEVKKKVQHGWLDDHNPATYMVELPKTDGAYAEARRLAADAEAEFIAAYALNSVEGDDRVIQIANRVVDAAVATVAPVYTVYTWQITEYATEAEARSAIEAIAGWTIDTQYDRDCAAAAASNAAAGYPALLGTDNQVQYAELLRARNASTHGRYLGSTLLTTTSAKEILDKFAPKR